MYVSNVFKSYLLAILLFTSSWTLPHPYMPPPLISCLFPPLNKLLNPISADSMHLGGGCPLEHESWSTFHGPGHKPTPFPSSYPLLTAPQVCELLPRLRWADDWLDLVLVLHGQPTAAVSLTVQRLGVLSDLQLCKYYSPHCATVPESWVCVY